MKKDTEYPTIRNHDDKIAIACMCKGLPANNGGYLMAISQINLKSLKSIKFLKYLKSIKF